MVWYTANTKPNQECSDCGGNLIEDDFIFPKDIEKKGTSITSKTQLNEGMRSMWI
jgi:hypothetical protein